MVQEYLQVLYVLEVLTQLQREQQKNLQHLM
jgi:hypothetical protein